MDGRCKLWTYFGTTDTIACSIDAPVKGVTTGSVNYQPADPMELLPTLDLALADLLQQHFRFARFEGFWRVDI